MPENTKVGGQMKIEGQVVDFQISEQEYVHECKRLIQELGLLVGSGADVHERNCLQNDLRSWISTRGIKNLSWSTDWIDKRIRIARIFLASGGTKSIRDIKTEIAANG